MVQSCMKEKMAVRNKLNGNPQEMVGVQSGFGLSPFLFSPLGCLSQPLLVLQTHCQIRTLILDNCVKSSLVFNVNV